MTREFDREDMANVGEALMEAIHDNRGHPFLKHWMPADSPAEIVVDLLNALDEARGALREARDFVVIQGPAVAFPDLVGKLNEALAQ